MGSIGVFTAEQARALWQDYLSRQQSSAVLKSNYPVRRVPNEVSPHRVFIRNDSGEEIPAYGCVQVTGVDASGGVTVVTVTKPDTDDAEYLFCSQFAIPNGDVGWAYRYGLVAMRGDPPSAAGVRYKVTVGAWTIEEGSGPFVVFGEREEDEGTLIGRFAGGSTTTPTTTTICPCGTTYSRGSITSLDPEQGGEHANEYQGTIPFKWGEVDFTVPYDSFSSWSDTGVVIFTCDAGDHTVTITLTVCESSHTVCGISTPQAKMTIVTDLNECGDDCATCASQDVSLTYICRNWHPLGTSTFEPVDPQDPTCAVTDCVICISPHVQTETCNGNEWPSEVSIRVEANFTGTGLCAYSADVTLTGVLADAGAHCVYNISEDADGRTYTGQLYNNSTEFWQCELQVTYMVGGSIAYQFDTNFATGQPGGHPLSNFPMVWNDPTVESSDDDPSIDGCGATIQYSGGCTVLSGGGSLKITVDVAV